MTLALLARCPSYNNVKENSKQWP